jgi:lysophospholipase L1-like esterase
MLMRFFVSLAILWGLLAASHATAEDAPGILRVFVLAGQSNMQGHAVVDLDDPRDYNGGRGNLNDVLARTSQRFSHLRSGDDWTVRDDVMVRYRTAHGVKRGGLSIGFSGYDGRRHFGPELQFGHVLGDFLDEPVLLIKTAWGGKSLQTDFRPPSAAASRGGQTGPCYLQMLQEVDEALVGIASEFPALATATPEISGFVWQQGWNDMISEPARDEYFANLVDLINDVRAAWKRPNLPVVVGELGNGGNSVDAAMKHFRRQQSRIDAHPPFVGNVLFAPTAAHARPANESPNRGHGHHWFGNAESYLLVGESLGQQMVKLLRQPTLPRVLVLGDSISMGYTPFVQETLQSEALVVRPMIRHAAAENCAGTDKGLQELDRWLSLGGGTWDVIHFNFGLHDLKHVDAGTGKNSNNPQDPQQTPPPEYERQLRDIVARLQQTGARLVFATTTPVPEGGVRPHRDISAPAVYNEIARRVMEENEIAVNDLYKFAVERLPQIQQPVNVHFTPEGSRQLGQQVVRSIRAALNERPD